MKFMKYRLLARLMGFKFRIDQAENPMNVERESCFSFFLPLSSRFRKINISLYIHTYYYSPCLEETLMFNTK